MEVHSALDLIRKSIPFERVKNVEETIPDFEEYIDEIMETVYRGHKGSFKVENSKARGMKFLYLVLYLLSGEPKEWAYIPEEKASLETEKLLLKHFGRHSYFRNYAIQYVKARIGRKNKSGWIRVEPYVFKLIGGEVFFYCTLKALLKVAKRALKDPMYEYREMTWEEGITEYLVSELKAFDKTEIKNV